MILSLSTITHYLSIIPILKYSYNNTTLYRYRNIIIISSSAFLLSHAFNKPQNILYDIDYLCAIIWGLFDLILAYRTKNKIIVSKIILLNFIVLITNLLIDYHKSNTKNNYSILHSSWHILSSMKCYYVSVLLIPVIKIDSFSRAAAVKYNNIYNV